MSKLTLDVAIKHCLEVAEQNDTQADKIGRQFMGSAMDKRATDCRECAADHRQLAEWLTDYKELKNSVGAVKFKDMKEAVGLLQELNAENVQLSSQLAEAKRLLRLAIEDMSEKNFCAKVCKRDNFACRVSDTCDFKWRHADEVLKLIGEER